MEGNLVLDLYVWVQAPCILISGKRKVLMGWYERLDHMCSIVKNVKSLKLCVLVLLFCDLMKLMMNLLRLRIEVVRPHFILVGSS